MYWKKTKQLGTFAKAAPVCFVNSVSLPADINQKQKVNVLLKNNGHLYIIIVKVTKHEYLTTYTTSSLQLITRHIEGTNLRDKLNLKQSSGLDNTNMLNYC